MALLHTPAGELGSKAPDFALPGVDGTVWTRDRAMGESGLLVMFICNHCPYVKAIQQRLAWDCRELQAMGVGCVAVMSNDVNDYPEDSFDNMVAVAERYDYPFPYVYDETQAVAKLYGAVCTPDFFGYNAALELRYRGRLDAAARGERPPDMPSELVDAMQLIAETGMGPREQTPSMGCSIKWRSDA